MEVNEVIDNSKFFGNVKKITAKEFYFDNYLGKYDETPDSIEIKTFSQTGKILSQINKYSRRWGDFNGFDLEDSSVEYFYNENNLLVKIIFYDENLEIDCLIEYFYNTKDKLSLIREDRIAFYQITEFQYYDDKLIKILTNSVTGQVKKDIILYDNNNRILSEESIFKKIEGNYPIKNPSKKYYYNEDSFITEYYYDNAINSRETKLNDGRLINRINYDDNGKLHSIIDVQYSDNIVTTVSNSANNEQIHKTIEYLDQNKKSTRKTICKDGNTRNTEFIFKNDEFNNCIYEEVVEFSKILTDYEYQ